MVSTRKSKIFFFSKFFSSIHFKFFTLSKIYWFQKTKFQSNLSQFIPHALRTLPYICIRGERFLKIYEYLKESGLQKISTSVRLQKWREIFFSKIFTTCTKLTKSNFWPFVFCELMSVAKKYCWDIFKMFYFSAAYYSLC